MLRIRGPRTIRDIIPPDKVFKKPKPKGRGAGTTIFVDKLGVIDGKGLPTARKGHRQKNASRSAYASAAAATRHLDNDPLGRELRAARLRQAKAEFDALG